MYKYFLIPVFFLFACSQKQNTMIYYQEGGHPYFSAYTANDTGFYCYPLKEIVHGRDSILLALDFEVIMRKFNEPNISLKPASGPVYRFVCFPGSISSQTAVIFVLRENKLCVKKAISRNLFPEYDTLRLTDRERLLYRIFEKEFPMDRQVRPALSRYFDSLISIYPELANTGQYFALKRKALIRDKPFLFRSDTILMESVEFARLINLINESGFWKLPVEKECDDMPTDAGAYLFEANAPHQYNLVHFTECGVDTSDFAKACDAIIEKAGLQNEFHVSRNYYKDMSSPVQIREIPLEPLPQEKHLRKKKQ